MRRVSLVVMAFGLIGAAASAKQPASANERAYTLTVMCSVVAANDKNDANFQRTADAVRKMAKVLGYTTARVAKDSIAMANVLGNEQRTNPNAMSTRRETCRKLALIG